MPKETHFFARPDGQGSPEAIAPIYARRFFAHLTADHRVLLDGSVSYLYSAQAVRSIDRLDPGAKFIVMVRNPVDLVHSYYHRLVYLMDEDAPSFAAAWELRQARARGDRIPRTCRDPRVLRYDEIGRLGHYLEQLFAIVGRERCHVVVFDDFASDAERVHLSVLGFIGVEPAVGLKVKPKNGARDFSSAWLQRLYANPPKPLIRLAGVDAFRTTPWIKRMRKAIKRRNTRRTTPPRLDPSMRSILHAHFREDIERLSALLGRDLAHWR